MPKLSPEGLRAVADIAQRTGFGPDAVASMLFAVIAGHGSMAQFSHPEFGGSGQWMSGGAIMLSDMFNNALKARVDALCGELAALVKRDPAVTVVGSFQAQSQGGVAPFGARQSSLLAPETSGGASWWPADLGAPASTGAQNAMRYAYFPAARRLAVDHNGRVTVYDAQDHQITGFSQQQSGPGSVAFVSQHGTVDVGRLPVVGEDGTAPASPAVADSGSTNAPSGAEAILAVIERLAGLRAKGVLTEAEFSAKKAELLSRL
jgi:hypothetical protein